MFVVLLSGIILIAGMYCVPRLMKTTLGEGDQHSARSRKQSRFSVDLDLIPGMLFLALILSLNFPAAVFRALILLSRTSLSRVPPEWSASAGSPFLSSPKKLSSSLSVTSYDR